MRLSKIKMAGFKSFVDPTTILLPSNLTGIVGPNGCGKSNTIDAVRWVMGESSAKHLRGDSMADVIFNGSSARKPVGQASVELVFDNSDGSLGGQYASYAEIAIKRVVSRDGQSVYHLNNARCRRRDITDIFLGTGLGPRSYAIIQQGTISRLIEARPDELRTFLEEAAGISKYKERRRETELRMRNTRENLDRLNDLREELDKQLARLERQARTAERYRELKEQERRLKGQLYALRWRVLDEETGGHESAIALEETALEAQVARQRAAEAAIERLRDEQGEAGEAFSAVQSELYGLGADIARLEQSLQHARERRAQQVQELAQVERAWNEAQAHQEADRRRRDDLRATLEELEPRHAEAEESAAVCAETLAAAEAALHAWQEEWEVFNRRAAEPTQTAQVERARIQQLEAQVGQLEQRMARIEQEQGSLAGDALEEEIALLHEQAAEQELTTVELEERLAAASDQVNGQREGNNAHGHQLDQRRTRLHTLRGRHASLEALQQAALGQRAGAVGTWLAGLGLEQAPRLAQGLGVEAGWERAVETVLGEHLEAVCVDGIEPLLPALDSLTHGGVTLFDTAAGAPPAAGGGSGALLERARGLWPLDGLLAGVYAVDDLAGAFARLPELAAHESLVTRDGVRLGRGWLRLARDADEHAGVLQREQELKSVAADIGELEGLVGEASAALEAGRERLRALEEERERLQREVAAASREQARLQSQASSRRARLEQVVGRRERLAADLAELHGHREEARLQMEEARARLYAALELMEVFAEQREVLVLRRDEVRARVDGARADARAERDAAHALTVRIRTTRTELHSTAQALERMEQQLDALAERREGLRQAREEGEGPLARMGDELEALLQRRITVDNRLSQARRYVEEVDHGLRGQEGERLRAEREAQKVRGELERLRMQWQELNVRRQTLSERVAEAGFDLEAVLRDLPAGAAVERWEQEATEVAQRIERLGPINLAAIDEYQQQAERKKYLDAQHADLVEALETLENAIRKIDRETKARFQETFDQVNGGLKEKFPRLFGGGSAYLELTGEDLLDTGVTIMARPPGKRNSTIHLLSGGEKALTAVALVFSIFELNPSPFCMLDEVDAPLDEANVGRFCELVREMSERVQFIFITHNKATMELATHLAGVTMHEPGVSRLVAVDVAEAVELAAV